MVNSLMEPLMGDHVGYHILHWIISQSGLWYAKFNENVQYNLRTFESGMAVIDEVLTPPEDDFYFFENNELGNDDRLYRFYYQQQHQQQQQQQCNNLNVNRRDNYCQCCVNDNENGNDVNQLQRNDHLLGIYISLYRYLLQPDCIFTAFC